MTQEVRPPPIPGLPNLTRPPSSHAMLTTPVDRIRYLLVSSPSARHFPVCRRVGVHNFTFEACLSFTRVTACQIARPPYASALPRSDPPLLSKNDPSGRYSLLRVAHIQG